MVKTFLFGSALANKSVACRQVVTPLRTSFALGALVCTAPVLTLGGQMSMVPGLPLSLTIYGLGVLVAAIGMHRSYPHAELGLCNLVTLIRLALTASLAALFVAPAPVAAVEMWHAFGVALTALLLDGVDGWAARRAGLASRFGARFDLEVDSVFALTLALLAWRTGEAGPWVLALGLPRYLFMAAGMSGPSSGESCPTGTAARPSACSSSARSSPFSSRSCLPPFPSPPRC